MKVADQKLKNGCINCETQAGVAIVEFALILPVLLLIALGGIELSRSLRHAQLAATLSREAASIAYRECTNNPPRVTANCLARVANDLQQFGNSITAGTELSISVYNFDATEPVNQVRRMGMEHSTGGAAPKHQTKLTIPGATPIDGLPGTAQGSSLEGALPTDVLERHRMVVVGEAFVPFEPLLGSFIGGIFGGRDVFYNIAII